MRGFIRIRTPDDEPPRWTAAGDLVSGMPYTYSSGDVAVQVDWFESPPPRRHRISVDDRDDALREALTPLLSWAEAVSQHHAMLRSEPPFTTTRRLKDALAAAYAALSDTP